MCSHCFITFLLFSCHVSLTFNDNYYRKLVFWGVVFKEINISGLSDLLTHTCMKNHSGSNSLFHSSKRGYKTRVNTGSHYHRDGTLFQSIRLQTVVHSVSPRSDIFSRVCQSDKVCPSTPAHNPTPPNIAHPSPSLLNPCTPTHIIAVIF